MKYNFKLLKYYFVNVVVCIIPTIVLLGFYAMMFAGGPLTYNVLDLFDWTYPLAITSMCFGLVPIILLILNLVALKANNYLSVRNILYNILGIHILYIVLILMLKPGWTKVEEFSYSSLNSEGITKNNINLPKRKISYVEDKRDKCQNQIIDYISTKYSIKKDRLIIKEFTYSWCESKARYSKGVSVIMEDNLYPEDYFTVTANISEDGIELHDYEDTYEEIGQVN